ncbi:MAG: flagellar hook protein FlgE [Syntrophomonas sp.]
MMRSMYSGVSGLKNHQTRMDVIGNNISNVNTAGYKKSRVVFKDSLYQRLKGATGATDSRGGTNSMGVGLGMAISSIDQIHTAAPTTTTNRLTDMAVDGNGYFVLENGNQLYFTRAGNFDFDENGALTNVSNGYSVQGWITDQSEDPSSGDWTINTNADMQAIDISGFKKCNAKATSTMDVTANLCTDMEIPQFGTPLTNIDPTNSTQYPEADDDTLIVSKEVVDSVGRSVKVYMRFFKTGVTAGPPELTNWACDVSLNSTFEQAAGYDEASDFTAVDLSTATQDTPVTGDLGLESGTNLVRLYNLQFDTDGQIPDPENTPWLSQVQLAIERNDTEPVDGAMANTIDFTLDLNSLTQYASQSNGTAVQNGYQDGSLIGYNVGTDGVIKGLYSNGETKSLARVALATFENPGGMTQVGGTIFQESSNSGARSITPPGESGKGDIVPSSLEMSNVDLAEELTDMIVTERGFQANSRIITTSDEMIQELVNLKR